MKHPIIFMPLVLAACGSQPVSNIAKGPQGDIEARIAAALKMQPGNWATKFNILAMDVVGTKDPKTAEAIQQAMVAHGAGASAYENCISQAQAAKPLAILFAGSDMTDCRYDSFTAAAGKMAAKMTCKRGKGTLTRTMAGTFTPTTFAFTTEMTGDGATEATALKMKTQTSAARTGACAVDVKNTV
jgi:Protein of unknown function (DUF3617)